ncbi:MAG: CDP-archaeol synthase [Candidatus Heimdallarchaeaceae archaeon]
MSFLLDAGLAIVFAFPILTSNAVPHVLGGGYPLDAYKLFFDKRRIFGDHKTIQGLLTGILAGFLTGVAIWVLSSQFMLERYGHLGFVFPFWLGLFMGFGCNFGDVFGSFLKRRLKIKSGGSFPVFDQMGYIIFGLLWSWPFFKFIPWQFWITLVVGAPIIHISANVIGYFLGIKDVPW